MTLLNALDLADLVTVVMSQRERFSTTQNFAEQPS